jgi:hypothetical protein
MKKQSPSRSVDCYIGAVRRPLADQFLTRQGMSRGMVMYGIPEYGVQFKCRADGSLIDLEFAAFLTLLKYITTSLKSENIRNVVVHSSNPQFVFAFTGRTPHLVKGSARERLIREFTKTIQVAVKFVPPAENRSLISPADYPSLPAGAAGSLSPDLEESRAARIRPFQRGIKL